MILKSAETGTGSGGGILTGTGTVLAVLKCDESDANTFVGSLYRRSKKMMTKVAPKALDFTGICTRTSDLAQLGMKL